MIKCIEHTMQKIANMHNPDRYIDVDLSRQIMTLFSQGTIYKQYLVSTGKNGIGEQKDSGCTPRGWHYIRAKIGAGLPPGAILVGRRFTGEIFSPALNEACPERDWILTRILWLSGLELGKNRLGQVDTMQRMIYIHGTSQTALLGTPASKGCIRMGDEALLEVFEWASYGTKVYLHE